MVLNRLSARALARLHFSGFITVLMGLLFLGVAFKRYSGYPTSRARKTEDGIVRCEDVVILVIDDKSYRFSFAFWLWQMV